MMLAPIYTKSLREWWVGPTVGMALVGVLLVLAMAAYQQIGTELYAELPEALRSVMGIPAGADAAALAYAVVFGLMASMTLGGLALSMGASSVAGEEKGGSIGVLLGNPISRRQLLASNTGAMISLVLVGGALMAIAGLVAPGLLGVEIGDTHVAAPSIHLTLGALVYGMVAVAVGAVTGNRSLAAATAGGVMVAGYLLVGLLPLSQSLAGLAKLLPAYWYDGHDPLNNGLSGGYLAVQMLVITALAAVAWWGVEARDLTRPTGGRSPIAKLVDRVRDDERAAKVLDRLQGGAQLSSIAARTASEGRPRLVIIAGVMFLLMGLLMGPIYAALADTLAEVSATIPDAMLAFVGGGDMSSPEGWYQIETLGLMGPIAVILVGAVIGSKALAGEEHDRTMGLLLANPVPRRSVVLQKFSAMALHVSVVGLATAAGIAGGSLIAGLGMSYRNIAAACLQLTLLGLLFGTLALAVGAGTGRVRTATFATVGAAGVMYVTKSVLGIDESLSSWARISPFEWYLGGDPLTNGLDWPSILLFAGLTSALLLLSVVLFDHRDLRRD
ncbi:MAG: ABC-2 type transport system permease protein [Nitriliruptoraceae bacterium]|jgi:ABC-2 type transport system permease protein